MTKCINPDCTAMKPGNASKCRPNGSWRKGLCHNCYTRFQRRGTFERKYCKGTGFCIDCDKSTKEDKCSGLFRCRQCYRKFKYKTDLQYKIRKNLRGSIHSRLTKLGNYKKLSKTKELTGCSIEFLLKYLENLFDDEMTWENYGKLWQIDHIMPLASFDLSVLDNQLLAFSYKNLQPLRKEDNWNKNDKLPDGTSARRIK